MLLDTHLGQHHRSAVEQVHNEDSHLIIVGKHVKDCVPCFVALPTAGNMIMFLHYYLAFQSDDIAEIVIKHPCEAKP